jgi:hypothetical protein
MPGEIIRAVVIAITGHRDYPDRAGFLRGLDRLQADKYLFGGARGADTDALRYLAETQPGATRVVVVPNRLIDQPVVAQAAIKQYANEIIELGNAGPDRYMIRNRYMVDHSDQVAAFYDGRGSGGTYNTIQYAESKGVIVDIMPLVEMNEAAIQAMTWNDFNLWLDGCRIANIPRMCVKSVVIRRMKLAPRGDWSGVLTKLHQLR